MVVANPTRLRATRSRRESRPKLTPCRPKLYVSFSCWVLVVPCFRFESHSCSLVRVRAMCCRRPLRGSLAPGDVGSAYNVLLTCFARRRITVRPLSLSAGPHLIHITHTSRPHLSTSFSSSRFPRSLPLPSWLLDHFPPHPRIARSSPPAERCQAKDRPVEGRLGQRQEIADPEGA